VIILDTNVLSETLRPAPSTRVLEWMRAVPASALFTTVITAELLYGIPLLPEGRRRQSFEAAVDLIFAEDLAGRVLPFDSAAAREFTDIAASSNTNLQQFGYRRQAPRGRGCQRHNSLA
jgi:hypothetical protein